MGTVFARYRAGVADAGIVGLVFCLANRVAHSTGISPAVPVAVAAIAIVALPFRTSGPARAERLRSVQFLIPGLALASLCALALPLSPFRHAFVVIVAVMAGLATWGCCALVAAALPPVLGRPLRTQRAPSTVIPGIITVVALAAVLLRGSARPDPDAYWATLSTAPGYPLWASGLGAIFGPTAWSRHQLEEQDRAEGRRACNNYSECTYFAKPGRCIAIAPGAKIDFIRDDFACPRWAELRVDPKSARLILYRDDFYPNVLFGDSSAHVIARVEKDRFSGGEESVLNAFAVGDRVRAPLAWIVLAIGGLLVCAGARVRQRRQIALDSGFWRHLQLVALATGMPLWVDVLLRVGL